MRAWKVAGIGFLLATAGCVGAPESGADDFAKIGEDHARALSQAIAQPANSTASYSFPTIDGWAIETDPLPPPWDAAFPFTGTEDLRFPPGWPDPSTGQWWSYDYLLWIDSGPAITAPVLESAVTGYYKGLVDSCTDVPCDPTKFSTRLKRVVTTPALTVFAGQTDMFDVLGTPITLNMVISSLVCPRSKHRALLFSVSPFDASAPIWKDLLGLQLKFRCN